MVEVAAVLDGGGGGSSAGCCRTTFEEAVEVVVERVGVEPAMEEGSGRSSRRVLIAAEAVCLACSRAPIVAVGARRRPKPRADLIDARSI